MATGASTAPVPAAPNGRVTGVSVVPPTDIASPFDNPLTALSPQVALNSPSLDRTGPWRTCSGKRALPNHKNEAFEADKSPKVAGHTLPILQGAGTVAEVHQPEDGINHENDANPASIEREGSTRSETTDQHAPPPDRVASFPLADDIDVDDHSVEGEGENVAPNATACNASADENAGDAANKDEKPASLKSSSESSRLPKAPSITGRSADKSTKKAAAEKTPVRKSSRGSLVDRAPRRIADLEAKYARALVAREAAARNLEEIEANASLQRVKQRVAAGASPPGPSPVRRGSSNLSNKSK